MILSYVWPSPDVGLCQEFTLLAVFSVIQSWFLEAAAVEEELSVIGVFPLLLKRLLLPGITILTMTSPYDGVNVRGSPSMLYRFLFPLIIISNKKSLTLFFAYNLIPLESDVVDKKGEVSS